MTNTRTSSEPRIVNGINVADVLALIDNVRTNPENGITQWKVASTWRERTLSHAHVESFRIAKNTVSRSFDFNIDEPAELGGGNAFANPQEYLIAALNACMIVGYSVLCALNGITLEKLQIDTEGVIDLRGFLGLEETVPSGYESLTYTVRIKGNGTSEQFAAIHDTVIKTSPNFYNISRPVSLKPALIVE